MDSYGTRSLREIVRILFSHWFMMLVILAVGGGGTWYVCENWAPRKYRSQVSLIYKRPANKNPINSDVVGERALEVFVKSQQQVLMSDLVLARAKVIAEDPTLRERWYELRAAWEEAQQVAGGAVSDSRQAIDEFLATEGVTKKVAALMGHDAGRTVSSSSSKQTDLIDFRKSIKLETPGGEQVGMTETFMITVDQPGERTGDSYKRAYYAADLVADMYIVRYQELQRLQNDPALRVMEDVVSNFGQELEARRKAYDDFIQENVADITGLEQLLKSGTEQGYQIILSEVRKNDATLSLDLAKDQANYDAIKKVLPEKAFEAGFITTLPDDLVASLVDAVAAEFMRDDTGFVEMTKNLANLETKRARVETQFLEESKDLQYIREQISRLKKQMLSQVVAYARGLELRVASRRQQKLKNDELVTRYTKDLSKVQAKLATYARLKNDFEVAQKQMERLEQDKIDAMANRLRAREAVTINKLDQASMPDIARPVVPLTIIYTIVACAVSLLLGVTLAFLADHFDHTLRSAVDAERYLGVPVVGSVKKRGRRIVLSS